MHLENVLEAQFFAGSDGTRRIRHGLDIAEHLRSRHVGGLLAENGRRLGFEQASRPDLEAPYLRRGD